MDDGKSTSGRDDRQAIGEDAKSAVSDETAALPRGVHGCAVAASEVYILVDCRFDARSAHIAAGDQLFPFLECSIPVSTIFRQNLIAEADFSGEVPLLVPGDVRTRVGKDILPEWTIANGHTAFIEVFEQQDAPFECLVDFGQGRGSSFELEPGTVYVFEALVAAHRLIGAVIATATDGSGVPQSFAAEFDDSYRGGRQSWDYKRVVFELPRSDSVRRLNIGFQFVRPSNPVTGMPGFLFIGRLSLCRGKPEKTPRARFELGMVSPRGSRVLQCSPNTAAFGRGNHDLVLRIGNSSTKLLPFSSKGVRIAQTHGTAIELSAEQEATYSYFQDGKFLFNVEVGPRPTLLPIAPDDFDGRVHHVAVRDMYGIFTYAEDYILFPASLTAYDLLQRETTPPIPAYLAPSARFRYLALKKHIERSPADPVNLAAVARAHQVLERGFETLKHFPQITLDAPDDPEVSIIIPVHNKFNVTYYCLAALIVAANKASFEVIIVDDGSSDETAGIAGIVVGARVIRRESPEGFVSACNLGAAAAKGKYLVFLNNDTEPTVGWLDELLAVFRTFDSVGLAGSKLLYPNGRLQEAGGIVWRSGNPWNYGRDQNPWDPRYCYVRQVDYVSGAALMISMKVWKEVGGFSDDFRPAYFEDTDLAFKVRAAGYKTYLAPHSIVYHFEGLSSGTDVSSGMKRFQEINRPKFKRKWATAFRQFGEEGVDPDLEKDRGIGGRIAFIDYTTPRPDFDAGSYAAVQEMKLVQALGFKVTFIAENIAFLGHYTEDLQRQGIEIVCAPFVLSLSDFIDKRGKEFAAFYITRYYVARDAIPLIRRHAPQAKIIFNLADLHFLRELRAGIAARNRQQIDNAVRMRDEELSIMRQTDVALSYNSVEHAVILSHNLDSTKVLTCPWVVEVADDVPPFARRRGIAFIGSYGHPPNVEAVEFFVQQVMPLLRGKLPNVAFHVYGTKVPPSLEALARDDVIIEGYVEDLNNVFGNHRIFVAPLLSGAGVKGKVLSAMSHGAPSILSPIAAEGIPLVPGIHGLIAKAAADWVDAVARLYDDEQAWIAISRNARELMKDNYSFANGVDLMREAFLAAHIY